MDPFSGLFQDAGNAIGGAVQSGEQDLGSILQNAKQTIAKIGDTAAQQASQTGDPQQKAKLHAVASDAYNTVAPGSPSLGPSPTAGASASMPPQPQPTRTPTILPSGKIAPPQMPGLATPQEGSAQITPQTRQQLPTGPGSEFMSGLMENSAPGAPVATGPKIHVKGTQQSPFTKNPFYDVGLVAGVPLSLGAPEEDAGIDAAKVGEDVAKAGEGTEAATEPLKINQATKTQGQYRYPNGGTKAQPVQPPGEFTPGNTIPQNPSGDSLFTNARTGFQEGAVPPRPAGDEMPNKTAAQLPGGDPKQIPQSSIDMLDNAYTVPAKKAMNGLYKIDTYRGILSHIKSGMSPGIMEQMPSLVSDSESGMVPKMIRQIVSNVKEPIPLKDPGPAAETIMDNNRIFVDDKGKEAILSDISRALPKSEDGKTVPAADALQYARALEGKAAEVKQGDTYLTNRGDKRYMAQALNAAADDVMDQLGKYVKPEDMAAAKTPDRISYLQSLSPRLAAQVSDAKNIPQLRSTIRDFVRFGQIVDHTDASSGSVFGKVGRAMFAQNRSDQAADTTGNILHGIRHPGQAAADITKGIVRGVTKPFDETPGGKLLKSLQEPASETDAARFGGKSTPKVGNGMKTLIGGGVVAGALGTAAKIASGPGEHPSNAESNNNAGPPQDNHAPIISQTIQNVNQLPSTMSDMPRDKQGLTSIPEPWNIAGQDGKSVALTYDQYKDERQTLENQLGQQKEANDPQSAITQTQLDQLDNQYNSKTNQSLITGWGQANSVDANIREAINLTNSVSPEWYQMLSYHGIGATSLRATVNPQFQRLNSVLEQIQKQTPYAGDLQDINSKQGLQNALQEANIKTWNDYRILMQETAGTAPSATGGGTQGGTPVTQTVSTDSEVPNAPLAPGLPGQSSQGAPSFAAENNPQSPLFKSQ